MKNHAVKKPLSFFGDSFLLFGGLVIYKSTAQKFSKKTSLLTSLWQLGEKDLEKCFLEDFSRPIKTTRLFRV